jgi:ubiquinone/menaquinone biosynthesis C-methylase UbiE
MDAALQRRVQRYGWDKASAYYESCWHEQLKPSQDRLLDIAGLKEGEHILDIACGTGLISFRAAISAGEKGLVLGTDISEKMIALATAIAEEKNIHHIKFERMDAEELKVSDETFDVVLCSLGLMYFPEPLKALKEMFRVLKPGGRAVVSVWGQRDHCGWAEIFPIVDKRVASEVCPMFFYLGTKQVLQKSFEAAGFEHVQNEYMNETLHYQSSEEACSAAFAGGPVALAYFKFDEPVKQEVHKEYLQSIKAYESGTGYDVPGEFVIAIGYKAGKDGR